MKTIRNWQFKQQNNNEIILSCDDKHTLHLFVLENHLIRVLFQRYNTLRLDRTWMVAPDGNDVPWEGRDRMSLEGFTLPTFELYENQDTLRIETEQLRLTVHQLYGWSGNIK